MPLPNQLATGYTGSVVPTVIADIATGTTAIYSAVTGQPVAGVQAQVAAQQQPYGTVSTQSSTLLLLVVVGFIAYFALKG